MESVNKKNPRLIFSRMEYKYLIPNHLVNELIIFFAERMELDVNNINKKPYIVSSIYYDSPDLIFYRDKIEGYPNRSKVRVRFYGDKFSEKDDVFIEIKNKDTDRIYKEREVVRFDNLRNFIEREGCVEGDSGNELLKKIRYLKNLYALSPKVTVKYKRISFLDDIVGFKVSFDTDLQAAFPQDTNNLDLYKKVFNNSSIMEIKFDKEIPAYVINLLRKYNFNKEPVSKYCYSLEKLCSIS
ncbi:VTC domain-containing protein [Patescibacteria group bacterium]